MFISKFEITLSYLSYHIILGVKYIYAIYLDWSIDLVLVSF